MLVLSNEDIEKILTIQECIDVLEEMYRDLADKQALEVARVDNLLPCSYEKGYYAFKHMGGGWLRHKIMALRLNSDIITHPHIGGNIRRVKIPLANGRWVGLVLLFSTETGELLAMFPDGVAQRMRVAATNGLGIKYLARKGACRVGLIGSGWQAGAQLLAVLAVRPVKEIKVYSLRKENREAFAEEMRLKTGANILPVESPEECVREAEIILAATSSLVPVIRREWLSEGVHVSCIKAQEVDEAVLSACQRVVVHTRVQQKQIDNILPGTKHIPKEHEQGWWNKQSLWEELPELSDLIAGRISGRRSEEEITCFVNNVGSGLQFAALGVLILNKARYLGLGRELPPEWFSQSVHP